MTPDDALAEATSGKLRPVYLIAGEERYLARAVLAALRTAALIGAVPGLNEDQIIAGESEVDAALSAAQTLPMMAKRRLVIVRSLERWEPAPARSDEEPKAKGATAFDRLAEYLKSPSPSTVLLLVAGKIDLRRKLVTAARSAGCLVECEPLPARALPGWVERAIRARGQRVSTDIAELIAELAGPDLGAVADAVERVCLYTPEGGAVDEDAVAECVVRLRPTTVWELVGAVGRRDAGAALSALSRVYDASDRGLPLVGSLAWSARQLLKFESAMRAGARPAEAAAAAGAPPFKANELATQVKQIPRADIERWLETLAGVDLALKGGSRRPPRAVLEHAILRLCAGRPAPRAGAGRSPPTT